MRALLLGSGGRESALAWALSRSSAIDELVAAPGNPGIAEHATLEQVDASDAAAVIELARRVDAGLVVVGPEAPLVAGVGDALRADGLAVFGPDTEAARIEGSKSHAKELMVAAGIPTAAAQTFTEQAEAQAYMRQLGPPYVVKADGLAAGKGVVVTSDWDEAAAALGERLGGGRSVVIEEFLDGEEVSLIAFTDGRTVVPCEPAQDYKRVYDGDAGPNTGGMGSYSPVPACPPGVVDEIVERVLQPMVEATAARGAPVTGALYAGLALTSEGPKVIEFNARFGDPETQALLPRLDSDFGEVVIATASGDLAGVELDWSPRACVTVVLASGGYPGPHETGYEIHGLDKAAALEDVLVLHAGTRRDGDSIVTAGGRVLGISALGDTFEAARERAYEAASLVQFDNVHLRNDIATRAIERGDGG
ncbi:MAG TPA: phosphoribosylamine--glycine ligase [Actinomycetota bacterium]|nr:phosphoribosylamine--glycine ligase [Actinomycetota bacterium]